MDHFVYVSLVSVCVSDYVPVTTYYSCEHLQWQNILVDHYVPMSSSQYLAVVM